VLIGKRVKKFLEKFGFSFTYLRVWYDFSPQQKARKKLQKERILKEKAEKREKIEKRPN
jgi:hypothetical protein